MEAGTVAEPATLTQFTPPAPASSSLSPSPMNAWPLWQRILFRFFFVYLALQITPWGFFGRWIPPVAWFEVVYYQGVDWLVHWSNAHVFHTWTTLVSPNGSGDTSWAFTEMKVYLSIAAVACVVWSILDRKRPNYTRLPFWLRMSVRYYVAAAALSYGIIKLFLLQMPYPTLSQLSTPLGDLLPMRFSWLFIGYSAKYQFFSGSMETLAGLLLLYRRTITAGLLAATGAFANVVMINMAYDVPVKLYSSHLLFGCLFLLALDAPRLIKFLVLNQPTPPTKAWDLKLGRPWQTWASGAVKAYLVASLLVMPLINGYKSFQSARHPPKGAPFAAGVYDVRRYVVNHDTIPAASGDTLRWKDVIIDNNGAGSVNTSDVVFWRRYRRGYFRYRADTGHHTVAVWKTSTIPRDSTFLFTMRYDVPDTTTIRFHTMIRGDSIHVELVRMPRQFQLAENQFHWLSEYNR
jgi:hypothetical protein